MKCETDAEQSEARNFFEKNIKKGPRGPPGSASAMIGNIIAWKLFLVILF